MLRLVSAAAFLYCIAVGFSLTLTSISEERDQGTLEPALPHRSARRRNRSSPSSVPKIAAHTRGPDRGHAVGRDLHPAGRRHARRIRPRGACADQCPVRLRRAGNVHLLAAAPANRRGFPWRRPGAVHRRARPLPRPGPDGWIQAAGSRTSRQFIQPLDRHSLFDSRPARRDLAAILADSVQLIFDRPAVSSRWRSAPYAQTGRTAQTK